MLSCLPTTEDLLWIPQIGAEALLNLVAAVSHSSIYDRRFDAGCARCKGDGGFARFDGIAEPAQPQSLPQSKFRQRLRNFAAD